MERVAEPELMDDVEQAAAYAAADFAEAHDRFVALFRDRHGDWRPRRVLDLGCGPADPTRRFARAYPECTITAVDGAAAMLALAHRENEAAGLARRIALVEGVLPDVDLPPEGFDTVVSNSLLHHLDDPGVLWRSVLRFAEPGGLLFVMDLLRPADESAVQALVARYAAGEADLLRRDFERSLRAAYRPAEIAAQVEAAGLGRLAIEVVSDRHLIVHGPVRPAGAGVA